MVKGLLSSGHALQSLGKKAGCEVLEGVDAGEGGLKVIHLASGLLGLLLDVATEALDAGPQATHMSLNILRAGADTCSGLAGSFSMPCGIF